VVSYFALDQFGIPPRHAHRFGVYLETFLFGDLEQLDQAHRILPEPVVPGGANLAADDLVAPEHARAAAEPGEQAAGAAALLSHLFVDVGEEHAGQMAD